MEILGDSFAIAMGSIEKDILINVVDSPPRVRQILRSTHIYICRDLISVYIFNL